jgi:hypothetical protein
MLIPVRSRACAPLLALLALGACEPAEDAAPPAVVPTPAAPAAEDEGAWARGLVGEMEELVATRTAFQGINAVEAQVAEVEKALLKPWSQAFVRGAVPPELAARLNGAGLTWQGGAEPVRSAGGIDELDWALDPTGASDVAAWRAAYAEVASLQIDVVDARVQGEQLILTARVDLRGVDADGRRRTDRALVELTASKASGAWALVGGASLESERLIAQRAPAFVDATAAWGLGDLTVHDRQEAIRRGGYALAVVDYDGDGRSDLLVGHFGPVQLFRNTGTGFQDVTKAAGLDTVGVVKSAAFEDLDGDGDRDLALLRFVEDDVDEIGDFLAYENLGDGTFQPRGNVLPRTRVYDRAMPLALGDFNNDGKVDIYVGFPGVRDFTSGIATRTREASLSAQGIWTNQGGWSFAEASGTNLVVQANQVYAHASLATDITGDGTPEIIVVDDSGRINPIYQVAEGDTGWKDIAVDLGLAQSGMSMGVSTADFNGDGRLDIMATNITLHAGQRVAAEAAHLEFDFPGLKENFARIADGYHPLILMQNEGGGKFKDVTAAAGLEWAGEAAAAGEWLDYNHDGLLDYYLPNGLWTSGPEELDSLYSRAELAAYRVPLYEGLDHPQAADSPIYQNDVHGGSDFQRALDANPILKLLRSHRTGEGLTYSLGGGERNRLWRNNGDGTFTEVGWLEGADRVEDGYIAAPVDIDGDGLQDLVLRNTDPALGQRYSPVLVLRNQLAGKAVTLALKGPGGTAVGARVEAKVGGRTLVRELRSVNGAVQAEPVAWLGLGDAAGVDAVTIRWPNGQVQELGPLAAGHHVITAAAR